jgi:hypothetical protein
LLLLLLQRGHLGLPLRLAHLVRLVLDAAQRVLLDELRARVRVLVVAQLELVPLAVVEARRHGAPPRRCAPAGCGGARAQGGGERRMGPKA